MEAGEIAEADPVVLAWALMGIAELFGMRDPLAGARAPEAVLVELEAFIARALGGRSDARRHRGTASYLPERWMTAAEVATPSGIPEGS